MASLKTPQQEIKDFEKSIALGDLGGMANAVQALRGRWDELDAPQQQDVAKLEAIFLSIVKLKTEARA
jgi:predicted metalloendopeptidase